MAVFISGGLLYGAWTVLPAPSFTFVLIGLGLGAVLLVASFGFAAGYRQAFVARDMRGVLAQVVMIGAATLLFAPSLAAGTASGAWAPVGLQVAMGAFLFGIGMQLGGACASGTLFSLGGGSLRMGLTLLFFCLGAFFGSLHLGWWAQLPSWGTHSIGHLLGWRWGVSLQGLLLITLACWLWRCHRGDKDFMRFLRQNWPLWTAALALAALNYATLQAAGHPWSVTWAFTLWGAKLMTAVGWEASTSGFWTSPFQATALNNALWEDTTSLMNMALVVGAFLSAWLSGRFTVKARLGLHHGAAAILGGLLMGYGARLAYGCNIGALFSGMASTSLHAWLWLPCALAGTWIGIKLRPLFRLT